MALILNYGGIISCFRSEDRFSLVISLKNNHSWLHILVQKILAISQISD